MAQPWWRCSPAIVNLKPIIFRRTSDQPAWIWDPQGGCGDTYYRTFSLNLDRPSIEDLGVVGDKATQHDGEPEPRADPLGASFHVAEHDPALVEIQAVGCSGTYEWGVELTSVVRGEQRVTRIGTPQRPLRSIGTLSGTTPVYSYDLTTQNAVKRTGEEKQPGPCR